MARYISQLSHIGRGAYLESSWHMFSATKVVIILISLSSSIHCFPSEVMSGETVKKKLQTVELVNEINRFIPTIDIPLHERKPSGCDVEKSSQSEWLRQIRMEAESGSLEAQYFLAFHCREGLLAPGGYVAAIQWLSKAAKQGYIPAQLLLAKAYLNGIGVTQDSFTAASWYQKDAEQGNTEAQLYLISIYMQGHDIVPMDSRKTMKWAFQVAKKIILPLNFFSDSCIRKEKGWRRTGTWRSIG